MSVPSDRHESFQEVTVDRESLRVATFGWSKLFHRFPRALPLAVDDYDAWVSGVPLLLETLKETIHDGTPLPADLLDLNNRYSSDVVAQAATLSRSQPTLKPLVDAFSWLCFLNPKQLESAVTWMSHFRLALSNVLENRSDTDGINAALTLWEIARRDGERRVAPLLETLRERDAFRVPTSGAAEYQKRLQENVSLLSKKKNRRQPDPERPAPEFGIAVLNLASWLITQPAQTRRRTLQIAPLICHVDILRTWQQHWERIDDAAEAIQRLRSKPLSPAVKEEAGHLKESLKSICERMPQCPSIAESVWQLQQLATTQNNKLCGTIARLLALIPPENRGQCVREWSSLLPGYFSRRATAFLETLGNVLTEDNVDLMLPCRGRHGMMWEAIEHPPRHYSDILQSQERCQRSCDDPLNSQNIGQIVSLAVATQCPDTVAHYYRQICQAGRREEWFAVGNCRLAHQLLTDPKNFMALLAAIDDWPEGATDAVATLHDTLTRAGWTACCEAFVLSRMSHELTTLAMQWNELKVLPVKLDVPVQPEHLSRPDWSERFPKELSVELSRLAAVAADAEQIANRVLKKNFPEPEGLQQEIDSLRSRVTLDPAAEHLVRRLARLEHWRANPPEISAQRIKTLAAKLRHQLHRSLLQRLQKSVDDAFQMFACDVLGTSELPEWMAQAENRQLLTAIQALPRAFRVLGFRLLRDRCGTESWDLLAEPRNQAFIEGLRHRGITTEPWLARGIADKSDVPGVSLITVSLEDDPIEVLHMGRHFQTCLTPGSFNFFSAVSNAVDINKRVLYARDPQGRVVGRCLLAISTDDGILVFNPYAHDSRIGFRDVVAQAAERLAEQMNTVVVPRGAVQCLVAPEWYDDGPKDITGRFEFLSNGSVFRKSLASIELSTFAAELQQLFAPLPLNALTLPWVIQLDELSHRPELIIPLLPAIAQANRLPADTMARAALLAYRAGSSRFAQRTLQEYAQRQLKKRLNDYSLDRDVMGVIVEIDPTLGLRLLRRSRPKQIRSDDQETDSTRRRLLARAHEHLGRTARAEKLRG